MHECAAAQRYRYPEEAIWSLIHGRHSCDHSCAQTGSRPKPRRVERSESLDAVEHRVRLFGAGRAIPGDILKDGKATDQPRATVYAQTIGIES